MYLFFKESCGNVHEGYTPVPLFSYILIRSYVSYLHPYHQALNFGYLQPDSLDPDGIIYSTSDLDVSFSITFGKVIGVE